MNCWIPLTGDLCVVDHTVMHAVTFGELARHRNVPKSRRRKTADALCGARGKLFVFEATTSAGEPGVMAATWPPRVQSIKALGLTKCPTCAERSLSKRTDWGQWNELSRAQP